MKKQNKYKLFAFFSLVSFLLVLSSPIAFASYAVSSPYTLTIEKGKYKEFDFQIQAYNSEYDLECMHEIGNTAPFEIIFNEQDLSVKKRSTSVVKGTVKAPKEIEVGPYKYDFCIECLPKEKASGATANIRFCGIPININIIEPIKEGLSPVVLTIIIVIPILLIILLIIIIILIRRNRKKKVP